jgi:hypothetical protein
MEVANGLARVRDNAPVIDDACRDDGGLPTMAGFEEGSLATMLPGKGPDLYDVFGDGSTAKYVPAGSRLRFQIHYAKVDRADTDRRAVLGREASFESAQASGRAESVLPDSRGSSSTRGQKVL